jgi:hypothetical protein
MFGWLQPNYSKTRGGSKMNIYEDEMLEQKLDEISNQMGHLVMDILLLSLKRLGNQNQVFNDFTEARLATDPRNDPF